MYQDEGFVVVSVSMDQGNIEVVKTFVEEHDLTFPTLHDPEGQVAPLYGVRGIPMTYFIDADGKAIGAVVGPRPWDGEDVQQLVEQLLVDAPETLE
ncbi:redoxin domain-containing protein [candidate division KSB3 bacterium]|uniref:Redoxin domain-containing protein n=1 Tax=candidate division KSB3 bacterium TaxID=2044937 RepID=A0A9D5JXF4_9BACT|nr:redoxin domain-containing protein [candidate division KSB3 bacterium]MBD3326087.1 redoxin domain-containing protein [candidate division KSB3 bacterium]